MARPDLDFHLKSKSTVNTGWERSARAWIADMGEKGDFGRRYVLDPVMLELALRRTTKSALDIGCGEGRFCRMLNTRNVLTTGLEPTPTLLATARERDPYGAYIEGFAEALPFKDSTFDLVVSYLSLIDVPDVRAAIPEMARVLSPGGRLLVANLSSFNTAAAELGWVKDANGKKRHFALDNYSDERAAWIEYRNIRVLNFHRPLSVYMQLLLQQGLQLTHFAEPLPSSDAPGQEAEDYRRAPWFCVMEWQKPVA